MLLRVRRLIHMSKKMFTIVKFMVSFIVTLISVLKGLTSENAQF